MKNRIYFFIMTLIISSYPCLGYNSLDSNWREFSENKQAWELGPVQNLVAYNNSLFATGLFDMRFYDSTYFNGIAQLQDSVWLPLGAGSNTGVRGAFAVITDLSIKDSNLFVVGSFDSAGSIKANNIAKWNLNSRNWSSIGNGTNGVITSILPFGNKLFVGGRFDSLFTSTDTIITNNIAYWDGATWVAMMSGVNGSVSDMALSGNKLYVVGEFDSIGTQYSRHIGVWNDSLSEWNYLGNVGPLGDVDKVYSKAGDIYFGGDFRQVFNGTEIINCKNIVMYSSNSWFNLGDGIDGYIYEMTSDGEGLIVVGDFTKPYINSSLVCKNIAIWDGLSWYKLGSGSNEAILSVATKGDSIFVGGEFDFTGDFVLSENIGLWYQPYNYYAKQAADDQMRSPNGSSVLNIYPNPVRNEAVIEFFVEEKFTVLIEIFDFQGNLTASLSNGEFEGGWHKLNWNCGNEVSGTYICRMTAAGKSTSAKLILER